MDLYFITLFLFQTLALHISGCWIKLNLLRSWLVPKEWALYLSEGKQGQEGKSRAIRIEASAAAALC